MPDMLKPSPRLLVKLGSLIVHHEEFASSDSHGYDKAAIDVLRSGPEVCEWIKAMEDAAMLPVKRRKARSESASRPIGQR